MTHNLFWIYDRDCGNIIKLSGYEVAMLSDSMLKRMMFCLCLCAIGCIAQPEYGDLEVQVDGRLSRAILSVSPDSPTVLDFEFRYLIGANDIDGISAFEWEYAHRFQTRRILVPL